MQGTGSLFDKLENVIKTASICRCHRELYMFDAVLENGKPVRVMESADGYHVSIGEIPAVPPDAISFDDAARMISEARQRENH